MRVISNRGEATINAGPDRAIPDRVRIFSTTYQIIDIKPTESTEPTMRPSRASVTGELGIEAEAYQDARVLVTRASPVASFHVSYVHKKKKNNKQG